MRTFEATTTWRNFQYNCRSAFHPSLMSRRHLAILEEQWPAYLFAYGGLPSYWSWESLTQTSDGLRLPSLRPCCEGFDVKASDPKIRLAAPYSSLKPQPIPFSLAPITTSLFCFAILTCNPQALCRIWNSTEVYTRFCQWRRDWCLICIRCVIKHNRSSPSCLSPALEQEGKTYLKSSSPFTATLGKDRSRAFLHCLQNKWSVVGPNHASALDFSFFKYVNASLQVSI